MKIIFSLFICLAFTVTTYAQAGGMRAYTGITTMTNTDKVANPDGFAHTGYHIGADGRLFSGGMAFLVGARYTSTSKLPIDKFKLSGHPSSLSVMNGRVGLDIYIFNFAPVFKVRTKLLGSFDIVISETGNENPPPGYNLNDGWLGAVAGLGADVGPITVDIEYEHGIINGYNKIKGSTFNSFSFSLGFFF